jgi:hypothetical protein
LNGAYLNMIDPTGMESRPSEDQTSIEADRNGPSGMAGITVSDYGGPREPTGNPNKPNTHPTKGSGKIPGAPEVNNNSNNAKNIANLTLSWIGADIAIPEPTDAALPKWVIYGFGAVAAGAVLYSSNVIDKVKDALDPAGFKYVTYTKTNGQGFVYVGRTSGYGSVSQIVKNRDSVHHMVGYGAAVASTVALATLPGGYISRLGDSSYWAIRGSEQLQIEFYRNFGISGNDRNGIYIGNKLKDLYNQWGKKLFQNN